MGLFCPKSGLYFGQMSRGQSIDLRAKSKVASLHSPGPVWTSVDFLHIGLRAAGDKALQRLAQIGRLYWAARPCASSKRFMLRSDPTPIQKRLSTLLSDPYHGDPIRRDLQKEITSFRLDAGFVRPLIQDQRAPTTRGKAPARTRSGIG